MKEGRARVALFFIRKIFSKGSCAPARERYVRATRIIYKEEGFLIEKIVVYFSEKAQDVVVKNQGFREELSFPKNYEKFRKNLEKSVDNPFFSC